jgi:hypothetical protein
MGTRPAPELARHERITRERLALPAEPAPPSAPSGPEPRDAIAIPADILSSSKNSQASATEARARSLSDADHLATLNAIWQGETAKWHADRYRQIVLTELPAGYADEEFDSPQATWLWRTMRAAEAAGLDVRELTRRAIAASPTFLDKLILVVFPQVGWAAGGCGAYDLTVRCPAVQAEDLV